MTEASIGDIITWQTEGPDPLTFEGEVSQKLFWPFTGTLRGYMARMNCDGLVFTMAAAYVAVEQVISVHPKVKQEGGSDEVRG